ncbi:MAG: TetR/AcrR family transcriptional regulator [Bacteroidetes bacterium]|nr:TetR/AcrR family transcriptional regulator [Bacteroidota bacterium]MCW5896524.1 TetR/AcrR family transcriptional regulator [Bacteroidota bacterium]
MAMGIIERKEREKEHRREEIVTAAEKIFFEKGLATATMDEIAEAAELSKGTLYLYYKSKEDLYLAVAMRGSEIMYNMFLEATSPEKSTIERVVGLGDAYYRFFKENPDYFRMYQYFDNAQFHRQVSEDMLGSCAAKDQRVWDLVIGLIQQGIDEGLFDAGLDAKQAAIILWANGNAIMRLMDREDTYFTEHMKLDLEATLQKAYQLILEGMMTKKGKTKYHAIRKVEVED